MIGNNNLSTCAVAERLNQDGVKTRSVYQTEILGLKKLNKTAARVWNAEKVWEIVRDYEYCGHSVNYEKRGKDSQIILYNTHEKIIDENVFNKAQAVLDKRSTLKKRLNHIGRLLIDIRTGKNLLYEYRRDKPSQSRYFLRIDNRQKYTINSEEIENIIYNDVVSVIKKCKKSKEKFRDVVMRKNFGEEFGVKDKLELSLKKLNEEYSCFLEQYFSGKISSDKYAKKSAEYASLIRQTEDKITKYNTLIADVELFELKYKKFLVDIQDLPKDKKEIIKKAVSKVYIESVCNNEYHIAIKYKFDIK